MGRQWSRRQLLESGLVFGLGLSITAPVSGQATASPPPIGNNHPRMKIDVQGEIRGVHDPAIIKDGDTYYLFSTGRGILMRQSEDLINWKVSNPKAVFPRLPAWVAEKIPRQPDVWAPDISYFNDKYHLYYSVSTFGRNTSVIGLATNVTLNPEDAAYEWVDEGLVIESVAENDYNCIDANVAMDAEGVPWLSFGSFWSGIKMRRLDATSGKLSDEDETLYALAQRRVNSGAVEAPFIIRKNGFYYLFVSFDFCCRGADSTYHVMVGRSEQISGPYVDRDGVAMMAGGGTQVTFPTERWRGPGHNSILQEDGVDYIVYHSYDAEKLGVFTLRIDALSWDDEGWPVIVT